MADQSPQLDIGATRKHRSGSGPRDNARPNPDGPGPRTRGGQNQEDVEDRPNVSTVSPEDYPDKANGKDL